MAKLSLALLVALVASLGWNTIELEANELDPTELSELAEAYLEARNDRSSVWLNYESCYVYLHKGGGEPNSLLASFDVDDTITRSKSGRFLPKNATDWRYLTDDTVERIQQTVGNDGSGRRLVLFTNQNGVGSGYVSLESVKERLEATAAGLKVPCTIFVAIHKDEFRKPQRGMYDLFVQAFNGDQQVNLDSSFYCGDAIGYPSFSDSDLKFAKALRLPFLNPQEFLSAEEPRRLTN